ncbi:hypothetical protein [Mesorhizobium sp. NZP2077]|uniref:hypothetical protein n=1 Tax=Mesorhizobium sp. NZP2077 TaxID=2483404 RepID=UPI001557C1C3|nr:hypothetical protein [Mesorhizobium sp. NZP2077]QKC84401.1 hypothetical protein EB232_24905 [Mesorhizobium sp. NZP2077]QKD17961.1 hypothetical protein HGP13_24605 [Mesorhizobium sp. NZP2077]
MTDLDLTKKGEAYVAASLAADPETLLVALTNRKAIADSIERLIDMLDAMSPDPDLEDTADDEPSLLSLDDLELDNSDYEPDSDGEPAMGAIERHPTSRESPWGRCGELTVMHYGSNSQEDWAGSRATAPGHDECEAENEHGGDVLDEPHDREDDEYELGWTEHVDQRLAGKVEEGKWNHPEGEPDLGWTGYGRGCTADEARDDREGDDEREAIDEREDDHGDYDGPGFISGGQGL